MMTLAPLLTKFINKYILQTTMDADVLNGVMAVKYGTDVNVRSFARECGLDEGVANSIAFMLSQNQKRGVAMFSAEIKFKFRYSAT